MTVQKLGILLMQIGGLALLAGIIMLKFPQIFSLLGKLPGDINIGNRVYILLGTSIALSLLLTVVSIVISFVSRLFR